MAPITRWWGAERLRSSGIPPPSFGAFGCESGSRHAWCGALAWCVCTEKLDCAMTTRTPMLMPVPPLGYGLPGRPFQRRSLCALALPSRKTHRSSPYTLTLNRLPSALHLTVSAITILILLDRYSSFPSLSPSFAAPSPPSPPRWRAARQGDFCLKFALRYPALHGNRS